MFSRFGFTTEEGEKRRNRSTTPSKQYNDLVQQFPKSSGVNSALRSMPYGTIKNLLIELYPPLREDFEAATGVQFPIRSFEVIADPNTSSIYVDMAVSKDLWNELTKKEQDELVNVIEAEIRTKVVLRPI